MTHTNSTVKLGVLRKGTGKPVRGFLFFSLLLWAALTGMVLASPVLKPKLTSESIIGTWQGIANEEAKAFAFKIESEGGRFFMASGNEEDFYEFELSSISVSKDLIRFRVVDTSDSGFYYQFVGSGRGNLSGGVLTSKIQAFRNGKPGQMWSVRFYKYSKGSLFQYIGKVGDKIDSTLLEKQRP